MNYYIELCAMGLITGALYYLNVGAYAYLLGAKRGIGRMNVEVNWKELLNTAAPMLLPFAVIVALLIMGHSVMYTPGFWATVSLVVITLVRKETRPSLKRLVDGFVSGAKAGAEIGVISAVIGLLLTTVNMTGIGLKLGAGIETWSGGS
ncbi:MAG: TRAP transporter large permease subunit [Thermodesulfobacteriota bacterium]